MRGCADFSWSRNASNSFQALFQSPSSSQPSAASRHRFSSMLILFGILAESRDIVRKRSALSLKRTDGTFSTSVLFEPVLQESLAVRFLRALRVVLLIAGVLHAPSVPLAESVIGPIPAILFKNFDAILEIATSAV